MPTPREQSGALSEASRLLQEGLQLLDDRTREVDALVQDAREEARRLTYDAQKQAEEITAEAERQRAELEEQVAALRSEVAEVREELAQLRATQPPKGGRGTARSATVATGIAAAALGAESAAVVAPGGDPATQTATMASPGPVVPLPEGEVVPFGPTPLDPVAAADAAEAAGTPRWGRPSSIAAAQQALRSRSSRPRWLPRWLPFLILILAGAGAVMASVNVQGTGRGGAGDPTSSAEILITLGPTSGSPIGVAAATSIATSLVAVGAAGSVSQSAQPATPSRAAALVAPTGVTPTSTTSAGPPTRSNQTVAATRLPAVGAPPPAPLVTPSTTLPDEVSPNGPILAAYTTFATYSVRPGDTLNRVATDFGVTGDSIMRASGLADPNLLVPGQVLTIPRESGWLYRVRAGETLDTIALRFGISASDLVDASTLGSPSVRPGDLLFIPNRALPGSKQ